MTKVTKGESRSKRVKSSTSSAFSTDSDNRTWWLVFGAILCLTFVTRFYKVTEPDHVCWDETHFGKMASWYINRTFFFDVHPPLGKMLIALSGYMTGYDGSFAFSNPGDKYTGVNYIGMRVFCTLLGAAIIPFCFCTLWEMTRSLTAAVLGASFVLFDIGTLTLTQYILLDPILLFFVTGSVMGMAKFNSFKDQPFSTSWWLWLVFTGIMLSCSICVKFVGLFIVIFVGLHTVSELWDILGDLTKPITYALKHFMARTLCLILLPGLLYSFFFYIHLSLLNKSGHGDGFYSSAFQSQLEGNSLHNASMPHELAYGAVITLKNQRTGGGYLHSHWHLYPPGAGARQQQITTYSHKDDNNKWRVKKIDVEPADTDPVHFVKHGDLIRLEHLSTRRNLHSHDEIAPLSRKHYQVTGYGENGTGDANDVWQVQIVDGKKDEVVTTVSSRFRLLHFLQNCVLSATGAQLPKWAYEQQEVSCNPNLRDKNAVWNVEDNIYAKLPNVSFDVYAPSFFERFLESHAVMLQGNAGLKPKEGEVTSRPWQWPINYKGQFFSGQPFRIYLLGNPFIWWGNILFLFSFVLVFIASAVYEQRGISAPDPAFEERRLRLKTSGAWLFIGWFLHYVPFWFMGRVLYFHHYFPALIFNSMITGIVLTYILDTVLLYIPDKMKSTVYHWIMGTILSSTMYSFILFSPLAYGIAGPLASDPNSTMHNLKWMDSWEF